MQNSELILNERLVYTAESTPIPHRIPCRTGVLLMRSQFVVSGSLVISGGTANGTSLGENPGNLFLQSLRIQGFAIPAGYPNGVLVNLGPRTLMRRKIFDHPEKRFVADQSNGINGINGAAGTYTLGLDFTKYWALPWLARPCDTALDTGMYGQLLTTFTTGARNSQYSGNDRTFNYTGVYIDVTHQFQRYNGNGTGPAVVVFDDERVQNINGANTRLQVNNLLPPDGSCTDLLFVAETTNQALADTIVNRVSVLSGAELFFDSYSTALRSEMEDNIGDSSTTTTPRTGLYWVKAATDGLITNAKNNVAAVIDQSNPGTDRLLIAYRRCQAIPAAKQQVGGGQVKSAA